MSINSKESRKEALDLRASYQYIYEDLFRSLFNNSVKVLNAGDLPKRYLLDVIYSEGGIAYDKETGYYLPYVDGLIDIYGLPKQYILTGKNGFSVTRKADEVVILRSNDRKFPMEQFVLAQIDKIIDIDLAIRQNLEAIKTMSIAEVEDQETLLSLANIAEARRIGSTIVFMNKSAMTSNPFTVQTTGAQYLVDKLAEYRKEVMNEALSTLGINVANVDKRERVQQAEILASNGYANDCIQSLIDTFNYDAEFGGLDIRLEGNTTLIEDRELMIEQQLKEIETGDDTDDDTDNEGD